LPPLATAVPRCHAAVVDGASRRILLRTAVTRNSKPGSALVGGGTGTIRGRLQRARSRVVAARIVHNQRGRRDPVGECLRSGDRGSHDLRSAAVTSFGEVQRRDLDRFHDTGRQMVRGPTPRSICERFAFGLDAWGTLMSAVDQAVPSPRRRWLHFSLRGLLVLIVIVAAGCNWWIGQPNTIARQFAAAIEAKDYAAADALCLDPNRHFVVTRVYGDLAASPRISVLLPVEVKLLPRSLHDIGYRQQRMTMHIVRRHPVSGNSGRMFDLTATSMGVLPPEDVFPNYWE
jgi:hypothetical protein